MTSRKDMAEKDKKSFSQLPSPSFEEDLSFPPLPSPIPFKLLHRKIGEASGVVVLVAVFFVRAAPCGAVPPCQGGLCSQSAPSSSSMSPPFSAAASLANKRGRGSPPREQGGRGGPNRTEVRRGEVEEGQSGDEEGDTQQVPPLDPKTCAFHKIPSALSISRRGLSFSPSPPYSGTLFVLA